MTNSLPEYLQGLLPPLQSCQDVTLQEGDLIIHAPGFEDRTMDIANRIKSSFNAKAILIDYLPNDPRNRLSDVRNALADMGISFTDNDVLEYHRFKPDNFEDRLKNKLVNTGALRTIIDISTMSKLLIMLILNVCNKLSLQIVILYSEAKTYGPSSEEFEDAKSKEQIHQPTFQIYTGIHGVVRTNSLASVAMQGQPTAAIVFMSFNDALTQVLLNTVYPSRLLLINGRPPVHAWREKATAWIHDQVRREWEEDNPVTNDVNEQVAMPERVTSTLYYQETVALLLDLYWQLSTTYRILLAPAGSKLQAVGCFLAKALHPDIHIEYPSPEAFFPKYSSEIGDRWVIDFGKLSTLLHAISSAETKEYLEIQTE